MLRYENHRTGLKEMSTCQLRSQASPRRESEALYHTAARFGHGRELMCWLVTYFPLFNFRTAPSLLLPRPQKKKLDKLNSLFLKY